MSPWLTDAEVYDLTHYRQPARQARQLKAMGIPYRERADGSLVVLRVQLGHDRQPPAHRPQVRIA